MASGAPAGRVLPRCVARDCRAGVDRVVLLALRARARDGDLHRVCELRSDRTTNSSSGERVEFWKKSLALHRERAGLRSRHRLDPSSCSSRPQSGNRRRAARRRPIRTIRPSLSAIQLGLVGACCAVGDVDRASAAVPRRRLGGVGRAWSSSLQNIVGSLFNSLLFDFTRGLDLCLRRRRRRRHGAASRRPRPPKQRKAP